jgi:DNA-directed RNA polymerase subunit beta'
LVYAQGNKAAFIKPSGKRVDYSGRAVIVVGPELKYINVGFPRDGLKLKPFIYRSLKRKAWRHHQSQKMLEEEGRGLGRLDEVIRRSRDAQPSANAAPLGIQAFEPVLIEARPFKPPLSALPLMPISTGLDGGSCSSA